MNAVSPLKVWISIVSLFAASALPVFAQDGAGPAFDTGNTAFMFICSVLVLLMTLPGLALFYGGLVRSKNTLSILVQCLAMAGVMSLLWVIYGYSFATTDSNPFIGGTSKLFLRGLTPDSDAGGYPETIFVMFQMTFAIITPALIIGAFAERIKFSAVMVFSIIWFTISYLPIWHMAWNTNEGFFHRFHVLDFAGGTVVHINAAVAGLVGCLMVGPRRGFGRVPLTPHNVPLVIIGASLLWVGWFGFNAGSTLKVDVSLGLIALNTHLAAAAGAVGAVLALRSTASPILLTTTVNGALGGLVGITAGCASMAPGFAILTGLIAGFVVVYGMALMDALRLDDVVGAVPVHGMAGVWGTLAAGLFFSGDLFNLDRVMIQLLGSAVAFIWAFPLALLMYFGLAKTIGLRVPMQHEQRGLDFSEHAESGYPEFSQSVTFDASELGRRS
jgi:ammonium transporter, Amt family